MRVLRLSFLPFLVATWLTVVVFAYPIDRKSSSALTIRDGAGLEDASLALRFDAGDVQSLEARQPGAKETAKRAMKQISRAIKRPFHAIMDRIKPHHPPDFDPNKMLAHRPAVHMPAAHGSGSTPSIVFQSHHHEANTPYSRPWAPVGPRPKHSGPKFQPQP